jgi:DNA-binding transcriptional MocR family regulator
MNRTNQANVGLKLPLEYRTALDGWSSGDGPLHQRVAGALASAIERQELLAGTRLPPERVLAAELGVGRSTVGAAYELLRRQGLVDRRQGRGTEILGRVGTAAGSRVAELATSLQRNILFRHLDEPPDETINLLGTCTPPSPPIRAAIATALRALDTEALMGDHGYFPLGYPPLRRAVAAHLDARGLPTTDEQILITGGAQQAISLLAACWLQPGQLVVLEDPTFPGAIDAFRAAGARILTVPVSESGADVELLAETIAQSAVQAVYLMPTFHNPTGSVMAEDARRQLSRLSRTTGVPIVEDDTLAELALTKDAPRPISAFAHDAPVISIGSLSKLFWAGLRIGWIRGPASVVAQLGRVKAVSDLGTSLVSQAIAVGLLAQAEQVVQDRRQELIDRLALLQELLEDLLPSWHWHAPPGGLSLWVRLPHGSALELGQVASRHGVLIVPGMVMSATGGFRDFIRLPFDHQPQVLQEGMRRLARAWEEYAATSTPATRRLDVII